MVEMTSAFHKHPIMVNEALIQNCVRIGLSGASYYDSLLMQLASALDPVLTYPVRTKYDGTVLIDVDPSATSKIADWCKENLNYKWDFILAPYVVVMEDENDAVMFKMVWG